MEKDRYHSLHDYYEQKRNEKDNPILGPELPKKRFRDRVRIRKPKAKK